MNQINWLSSFILRLIFNPFILMQHDNYNLLKYWYHQLFTNFSGRGYKFKFEFKDYSIAIFALSFYFLIVKWTFELLTSSTVPLNANQWIWFGILTFLLLVFGQPFFLTISVICTFPINFLHKIFLDKKKSD